VRRSGGFAGVQGQVEALGVADDHRPVGVGAGAGRVEPEPGRIDAQAALLVTDQQAEMRQGHGQVASSSVVPEEGSNPAPGYSAVRVVAMKAM
jgi:hypothetical protein